MPFLPRTSRLVVLAFGLCAAALVAVPNIAQSQERARQSDRPSRACVQEIRELCGSDRSQMRTCLQQRFSELSEGCASELRARIEQRRGAASDASQADGAPPAGRPYVRPARISQTIIFGEHQRQQVDIYAGTDGVGAGDQPLIVFIHGGGWMMGDRSLVQAKPQHFNNAGMVFASAGYRLLPDTPVEQQAADLGAALRALIGQAGVIGFDPGKIVLMGHSAGAHLAALLATDPTYAGEAAFAGIRGVILLDGAGYDVAANIAVAGPREWQIYTTAFGREPARQAALSPLTHVGGLDAPHWLALYVEEREVARNQATMLVDRLTENGVSAQALAIAGTDHGRMNRELGTAAGAAQTQAIDAFLARILG